MFLSFNTTLKCLILSRAFGTSDLSGRHSASAPLCLSIARKATSSLLLASEYAGSEERRVGKEGAARGARYR